MVIDARNLQLEELFRRLREILASKIGTEVFIEILFDTHTDTKKIKAFVSMSGCQMEIGEKEGDKILRITGSPCCV